ncbi:hypothetical protein [Nostoc sp. MG11]|uniref:hypothetical protein n=1 Tax=Nostoc sp. MG11 TaxID=2721166 RepID=UPI0018684DB4|nr:hypothetical protein [Nostoc sp. MG11]
MLNFPADSSVALLVELFFHHIPETLLVQSSKLQSVSLGENQASIVYLVVWQPQVAG